ncbi:MAG: hypothetical protein PHQ86_06015 [Dehalococcoidales bacterium]|nr:hypothetical protein [Dehalococcoidales bacterium]
MYLKRDDTKTLIDLISAEVDRLSEARKKKGFCNTKYFYHLIDIRNKLLIMFSDEKTPLTPRNGKSEELLNTIVR